MRIHLIAAVFAVASSIAFAGELLVVNISNSGVAIEGVTYKNKAALVVAFRKLNPSSIRFAPAKDATYQTVLETLQAFQESGIKAQIGFVGAAQGEN